MRSLFHSETQTLNRTAAFWVLLCVAAVAWAFVRTAATTEDAFITFRVIDNALNGHGLVWNVGERVQVYTHPLWALLLWLGSVLTGDIYLTGMVLSLALTLITVLLISRFAAGTVTALWATVALLFSESFIEYSSAALETALANALIVGFVLGWKLGTARGWQWAALCAGLLAITRHDLGVLVAPALLVMFLQGRDGLRWRVFALAALPLLAWSAFAVIYYGSPWPNSAYAKLNNGLSLRESFAAAVPYFRDLIKYDAVTALVIVVAIVRGLVQRRWQMRALALGLLCYLLYLGSAGGDYMGGRLFATPFVMAVALLALSLRLRWWWTAPAWLLITAALGLMRGWMVYDVYPHSEKRPMSQHAWMYPFTGWQSAERRADFSNMPWAADGLRARQEGTRMVAKCAVGLYGYSAGPGVYIVDPLAIADAFLARLPSKKPSYPGHYERALPAGYVETLRDGTVQLKDSALAELYQRVNLLTRAPLFDKTRWQAIWALNTGGDKYWLQYAQYDPNATYSPDGRANTSTEAMSCMGQFDPLLTVRIQ